MSFASCIYLALELTSRHSAGDQNCSSRLSFSKEMVSWHKICRLLDTLHLEARRGSEGFLKLDFDVQRHCQTLWCCPGVPSAVCLSVLFLLVLFWFYLSSKAPARCRIAYVTQVCRSLLSQIEQSLHSPDHFATVNTFVRLYKEQYCTLLHHVTLLIGCCDHR